MFGSRDAPDAATDRLVALQFVAVVLPIAVVLLMQMAGDAIRAATLEHSRPQRVLADRARLNYKIFINGAADAVDTGTLSGRSVDALQACAALLSQLAVHGEPANVGEAAAVVNGLPAVIAKGMPINALLPLQARIREADRLTKSIDDELERRDELVVKDAITGAHRQKRDVAAALIATAVMTVAFVLTTRRRLKMKLAADFAAERERRAVLEALSVRFDLATRAAGAGVYELERNGLDVWWSKSMYELYAIPPESYHPTLDSWLGFIHADDRPSAQASITRALSERSRLELQYRVPRPDGSVRHVATRAAVTSKADGGFPRLIGIELDITERVLADERERRLQQQLRDASRRGGMAEVATNVLHNVGNVLNSVNISASMLSDRIKRPTAAALSKVVDLIREHEADLGSFVTTNEHGRHLPFYLANLAEHLSVDQAVATQELDSLRKNIDHIKEIVSMQQCHAKLVGVSELVSVESLVGDALRVNTGAFGGDGVRVQCDFAEVPEITVERHKVLQILVNLLRNAKYACEATARPDKQVDIRVQRHADGVTIAVRDNGIGILPEHMLRLFSHGFTTKKDGHGFGLHSGALAAQEMGGALRVDSAGPDQGATFTLELPLRSPESGLG